MSEEITLQELLPNEFYLDKEGNIVAEISLKQINQIGDILVNYHKENERLNKELEFEKLKNKEVREYIETIIKNTPSSTRKDYANMILIDYRKFLEILDKEK